MSCVTRFPMLAHAGPGASAGEHRSDQSDQGHSSETGKMGGSVRCVKGPGGDSARRADPLKASGRLPRRRTNRGRRQENSHATQPLPCRENAGRIGRWKSGGRGTRGVCHDERTRRAAGLVSTAPARSMGCVRPLVGPWLGWLRSHARRRGPRRETASRRVRCSQPWELVVAHSGTSAGVPTIPPGEAEAGAAGDVTAASLSVVRE
jgi:hypothetical protein